MLSFSIRGNGREPSSHPAAEEMLHFNVHNHWWNIPVGTKSARRKVLRWIILVKL